VIGRRPFETKPETEERLKEIDAFFVAPICRKCSHATSIRSEKPLSFFYPPSRFDGAFGSVGHEGGPSIQVVSEEFLELLTSAERKNLELRLTVRKRRARRSFFEVIGPGGAPYIGVTSRKPSGWRCTDCAYRCWGYRTSEFSIDTFIAKSDLPKDLPGIFTVGTPPEIHLVATAARWRELVGRKGTRGFVSLPLGVVPNGEVLRVPELPLR
jgi:hypothetical protein